MWVIDTFEVVKPSFYTGLEFGDRVAVAWDSEDTFGFCASKCEDPIGEEGEDDGYSEVWVRTFLQTDDGVKSFAKYGRIERSVLTKKINLIAAPLKAEYNVNVQTQSQSQRL